MWRRLRCAKLACALLAAIALHAQQLEFAVIGDPGTGGSHQRAVAAQMFRYSAQHHWEFILSLGDNVYEDGNPAYFGPKFKDIYQPLTSKGIRIHSTLGNHDAWKDGGASQVADPGFGYIGGQDEYVFEAGPVAGGKRLARFLCLNSVAWLDAMAGKKITPPLEERKERLRRWLADSRKYHWNILYCHHPLYSYVTSLWFHRMGHGSSLLLRKELEPLIVGRIDLVLTGHDHFYQRIKPQAGILYVVSGAAGKLRPGVDFTHPNVAKAASRRHFLNVEVTSERLSFEAVAANGEIIDQHEILKTLPGPSK